MVFYYKIQVVYCRIMYIYIYEFVFKYILKTNIIIFLCPLFIYAQYPPDAALFPLDVKTHGMGNSGHINNIATTNLPEQYTPDNFPNINMAENGQKPCCAEDGSTFAGTGIYTLLVGGKREVHKRPWLESRWSRYLWL